MDSPEEELGQVLGIGDHCSVGHCRQIDFLPFKCDCCNQTFCLEHRSYTAHTCPNAGAKETTVIVCPICAKGVRLSPGQEPNEAFDVHQRTECDPANYNRVHKKPRCPVGGCKEKLTTINAYRCKNCSQRVCLRHRDPGDHKCTEAQAALRQQRGSSSKLSSGRTIAGSNPATSSRPSSAPRAVTGSALGLTSSAATATAAAAVTTSTPSAPPSARCVDAQRLHNAAVRQYEDPANSVRGTAGRRQQMAQQAAAQQRQQLQQQHSIFQWPWQQQQPAPIPPQQQQQQATRTSLPAATAPPVLPSNNNNSSPLTRRSDSSSNNNANPLVPPHLPEQCPQCGASFATVERLIQHVEDFHPSAAVGPAMGAPTGPAGASVPLNSERRNIHQVGSVFTNPLRGFLGTTTIAGGEVPPAATVAAASGPGLLYSGAGGGSPDGGARDVYRCYFCARTFNDPVLLVQHSDRCAAAVNGGVASAAVDGRGAVDLGGRTGRSGGGGGSGGSGGSTVGSKDNCTIC